MRRDGFEPNTAVFERLKRVRALNCEAALIGTATHIYIYIHQINIHNSNA
jgi:hypothetical protein